MKTNQSAKLLVLLVVLFILCGCQAGGIGNTPEPELDKEQIIKIYSENKDAFTKILEYAETTEGGLDAAISGNYSRFANVLPDGVEKIKNIKVIANIKSLHKKFGLYGVCELYGGGAMFTFAAQDEKGVLYTNNQSRVADRYSKLEQIEGNWYYYEIETPE